MKAIKTKFQQVSLEQLKKIIPDQVLDGNDNHNKKNQKDKKKDTRRITQTRTAK
jgi:hypothetical protein